MVRKYLWLIIIVIVLIFLAFAGRIITAFSSWSDSETSNTSGEVLIIWGWDDLSRDKCLIWIISPLTDPVSKTTEDSSCHYQTAKIEGRQRLISFEERIVPTRVLLHEVDDNLALITQRVIDLQGVGITSTPQWGPDENIYFGGVLDSKEQVFRFDAVEETLTSYLDSEEGFATDPLISPSGKHLAYQVWVTTAYNNRFDCQLSCFNRVYRIVDIEQGVIFDPRPLMEPVPPLVSDLQCGAEWSPTGRYLVIEANCETHSTSTIVIDVVNNEIEAVFNDDEENYIRRVVWISDDELLLYKGAVSINVPTDIGYWVYSTETKTLQKNIRLAERNKDGSYPISLLDWSQDRMFAVGTTITVVEPSQQPVSALVIINASDDGPPLYIESQGEVISSVLGSQPRWSPSGNFIAYYSYEQSEDLISTGEISIVDSEGEVVFTSTIQAISPRFDWVTK